MDAASRGSSIDMDAASEVETRRTEEDRRRQRVDTIREKNIRIKELETELLLAARYDTGALMNRRRC